METITITSLLVLLFSLIFFTYRRKPKKILKESGIAINYKTFIDEILSLDKTAYIESSKVNAITIRTSSAKNASVFSLTEVPGRIIIVWTWKDRSFGARGKEWSFPDYYDQLKMHEEIIQDILSYQIAVHTKYNQKMSVATS